MIWKCGKKNIVYGEKTLIMGILNVTPDSFSDGGEAFSPSDAKARALQLEKDGADIIDIGGQSTRPKAELISADEELKRIIPVLNSIKGLVSVPISVDTFYPSVAEAVLKLGADIINDVSGKINESMAEAVKNAGAGWVITHNGHASPDEVKRFFEMCAQKCAALGVEKSSVCFDPGIGFGKNYGEDMRLLANAGVYKTDGFPLLLGFSRKRVIGRASGEANIKKRIYGNIAADTAAIFGGADIIRLHDVKNEKAGILAANNLKGFIDYGMFNN